MKKLLPLLFLLLTTEIVSAQHQIYDLMERTDLTINEANTIANRYFDSAGTGRGTGYKQFQRWLYERKFHTDENGYFIDPKTEWNNFLQSRNSLQPANRTEAGNWTELGPMTWNRTSSWNPGTGRLSAMAIHPANESVIYVGSPGGGLWKTINGGATWTPLTDNNSLWMSIFAITIDPFDQNIVYVGTNNGILLKSTNGGITFSPTGSGPSGTIRKILIHPTSSNIVFACSSSGIHRSTNGGSTWTLVLSGSKEDIEFNPADVNIMYASGNDVVRSTNNGVSWTTVGAAGGITNSGRTLVAVSAANPNYVYAVQASGSLFGRMYKSTDAGLTFTTTVIGNPSSGTNYFGYNTDGTGTTGQATYDMAMDVSPTNAAEVYIAGIICWKSTNEASTFTAITAWSFPNSIGYNHADVHGLFWINSTIYSISDGGIFKSTNAGGDWIDISAGLGIRQFYRIANSPTNANVITGGAQDNGSATRQASGNWVDWLGADGMEGLVSPTNHLKLWGTSQNGSIYRSTNGGNSYSGLPKPSNGQWVTPLAIHPTNEDIVYGGWTGVYKSINGGSSWTNISSGIINVTLADLAVAPSNPNYIYASTGSTLYVTTDDGATWTTRTAPSTINDIAVDPTNPSKIWIACNSSSNRVFVSTNEGATFTNISSNLPGLVARTIVTDDNTPRGIYVGMNIGVYYQQEGAGTWTDFSDNLPLVAINELEIQKAAGKIRVASYGRGVWESPVANAAPPQGFGFSTPAPTTSSCPAPATMSITLGTTSIGGFTNPITLSATAGVPSGTNITFSSNPVTPGNSTIVNLNNANTLMAGTYVVTITGTASAATTQTRDITFTINAGSGPSITIHPADQTVCAGLNTSFSITALTATSFQWYVSTDGGITYSLVSNGGIYTGATSNTLTLTGVTAGVNNNRYRCIASTICGTSTSNAAILTVNTSAVISSHPQDVTLCSGNNHTFCVTATGTNLIYQWQTAPTCSGPWTNISGANASCLPLTNITATAAYRCMISNSCATAMASNCATVTIVNSVTVTTHPSDATVCVGVTASFTVAGSGSGINYQWQLSTDGGATYNNITAPNSATYSVSGVSIGMNGNKYRCQLSNPTCTSPGISNAGTLTVNSLPAVSSNPQNATLCVGGNNTFSITASGSGIVYQWQFSNDGGITYSSIGGATTSSYAVSNVTAGMNGNRYRCIVSGTCTPSITSTAAILTVISPVVISLHPANSEVCSGSNATLTVAGNSTQTILYQWQISVDGGATWTNISGSNVATLSLANVTTGMNGNRYRCLLSNSSCPTPVISNSAIITVRQLPTIGLSASPLNSLLPGQTTTLTATPSASTGGIITTSWLKNGIVFANSGNTFVVNVENTGSYQTRIQETFSSGLACSNQSSAITIDAAMSSKLFIFPTPNDGQFTVAYYNSAGTSTSRTVTVFDAKGSNVYHTKFPITGPYTLLNIDIKPALRGIYFVVIGDVSGKKVIEGKVLVH